MPRKYSKSRRPRRRRRARKMRVQRPILSGFPSRKLVKLKYVDSNVTLDPTNIGIAGAAQYVYRMGSLFDPDYTGVGHQPMCYDQWSAIYRRYTVLGAKITAQFVPNDTSNVQPGIFGIIVSRNLGPLAEYSSIDNLLESKFNGSYTRITSLGQPAGGSRRTYPTVTRKYSAKKLFGVNDVMDNHNLGALTSTSPENHAYASVFFANYGSEDPGEYGVIVTIEYIAMFTEPRILDGS